MIHKSYHTVKTIPKSNIELLSLNDLIFFKKLILPVILINYL